MTYASVAQAISHRVLEHSREAEITIRMYCAGCIGKLLANAEPSLTVQIG